MLELDHVVKHYHVGGGEPIRAVDGVSMKVGAGEIVALYGPSGSGKTTLIELIARVQTPDSGRILVDGRDVVHMARKEGNAYLLNDLGIVMQPEALQPGFRAIACASVKLMSGGRREAHRKIRPLMVELGLGERLYHRIGDLSMGERQRVLIALALSLDPKLVLADEPTASLDTERSHAVLSILRDFCHRRGTALLLVTHDPEAAAYADRTHELRDGRLGERRARRVTPNDTEAMPVGSTDD